VVRGRRRPPFRRPTPTATLAAILHDPPGRPWRAGPLEPVLLALLAKDPTHRPSAVELRRLLEPVAADAPAATVALAGGVTDRRQAGPAGPTALLPGPAPPPGWGQPRPPGPRRRRGTVTLPGWSAPPRRRRGRWLLLVAGVLALLAVAANLGQAERREQGPVGLGDPVQDGQFEFVVRSVACGTRSVGQGLARKRALAQFCLVDLRVENTGTEGRAFAGGSQYLFDDAGKRHDPDLDATVRHGDGRLLSTHLNPGQRLEGTLVYDVPDPVQLARVELHDGPFSGGASVVLG
jgi:Domain of unknown function (DUF4352)